MRPVSCIATNSVAIEPIVMDGRMLVIGGVDGALYGFRVGYSGVSLAHRGRGVHPHRPPRRHRCREERRGDNEPERAE